MGKTTYVVIHRSRQDAEDIGRGIHREHWGDSIVCWCSPIVLTTEDKLFDKKVGTSNINDLGKLGDGVVVFHGEEGNASTEEAGGNESQEG